MSEFNYNKMSNNNTPLIKFTPTDFEPIKHNGFIYPITPETIAIIQGLADQVGVPEYII